MLFRSVILRRSQWRCDSGSGDLPFLNGLGSILLEVPNDCIHVISHMTLDKRTIGVGTELVINSEMSLQLSEVRDFHCLSDTGLNLIDV